MIEKCTFCMRDADRTLCEMPMCAYCEIAYRNGYQKGKSRKELKE